MIYVNTLRLMNRFVVLSFRVYGLGLTAYVSATDAPPPQQAAGKKKPIM
jgi:hypothetical protein